MGAEGGEQRVEDVAGGGAGLQTVCGRGAGSGQNGARAERLWFEVVVAATLG